MYNLLTLILPKGEEDLQAILKLGNTVPETTPKIMSALALSPVAEEEEDLRPGDVTKLRQQQKKHELYEEAKDLLDHYSKQTLTALVKCTKYTLETIKRRMTSPSAIQYGDSAEDKRKLDHRPAIKVKLILAIPHIGLKPALDEVQGSLNATVQKVLGVHKNIMMWGQRTGRVVEPQLALGAQSSVLTAASGALAASPGALNATSITFSQQKSTEQKTFYKAISENKEIAKLVSMMTTTISSAKVLVTQSLEQFKQYEELWNVDRNEFMTKFMEEKPSLSEFEAKMREYTAMDDVIAEEEELLNCGSLALIIG